MYPDPFEPETRDDGPSWPVLLVLVVAFVVVGTLLVLVVH